MRGAKAVAVEKFGLGPVTEWQRRINRCLPWLMTRWREELEVRRLRGFRFSADEPVIVIPTIGRPELQAAVNSALSQHHPCQVVVVADGRPLPALQPDERVHVLKLSRPIKVAGAVRNVAMRTVHADVYAFLDDDNVLLADHLSKGAAQLDRDVRFVYSQAERVDSSGQQVDVVGGPPDRQLLKRVNFVDASCITLAGRWRWSRLPRRGDAFSEDWEIAWRAFRRPRRVAFQPAITVRYAVRDEFTAFLRANRERSS